MSSEARRYLSISCVKCPINKLSMGRIINKESVLSFLKTNWQRLLFFIFVFLLVGTTSIWIPAFLLDSKDYLWQDWTIGIATFATASICSGALELVLHLFGDGEKKGRALICLVAIIIIWVTTILISIAISKDKECWSKVLACLMFVISSVMWWVINYDNVNFSSTNPLGGDAK